MNKQPSLLSSEEWIIYEFLTEAYNRFVALPIIFEFDQREFATGINALKNIVLSRPVMQEVKDQGYPPDQIEGKTIVP